MSQPDYRQTEWETNLTGEILILRLISKILYTEPEPDWIAELSEPGLFNEAPFAMNQPDVVTGLQQLARWSDEMRSAENEDRLLDLRIDYTQLLVGGNEFTTPPWESVYFNEDRMLFQKETLEVRAWYRRFGLAAEKQGREPDDHIALELSFLAHLASLALEACHAEDWERYEELMTAQRDFLSAHVLRWALDWCDLMVLHARTDFYHGTAFLLRGVLTELELLYGAQPTGTGFDGITIGTC
ncbi:MAG: molecular chaperone TorD family protein [Anaerolineales bacterium]